MEERVSAMLLYGSTIVIFLATIILQWTSWSHDILHRYVIKCVTFWHCNAINHMTLPCW